ncbi:unnamed protein product [Sphagnum compactum]
MLNVDGCERRKVATQGAIARFIEASDIQVVHLETGKAVAKTARAAAMKNGNCQWQDPVVESMQLQLDQTTNEYEENVYKLLLLSSSVIVDSSGLLGLDQALNGFVEDGWATMISDGMRDVSVMTIESATTMCGQIASERFLCTLSGGILRAKASMHLQEHCSEWVGCDIDASAAAAFYSTTGNGTAGYSQLSFPLVNSSEQEEVLPPAHCTALGSHFLIWNAPYVSVWELLYLNGDGKTVTQVK